MTDITAKYRGWQITVTVTITATKDDQRFELTDPSTGSGYDCEPALRAVKAEVDAREGPEQWIPNYTNEALL